MESVMNALILISNYIIVLALLMAVNLRSAALGDYDFAVLRFSNFGHGEIMSFGTMLVILTTFAMQSIGLSIGPLPTA